MRQIKKILELLRHPDDKVKLLFSVSAMGLLIVAAMLVPLGFRNVQEPENSPEPVALGQEQKLFADYWILGPEKSGVTVAKLETVNAQTKSSCEMAMASLVARCLDDRELDYSQPTGSEYTRISNEAGEELFLCRMWLEATGDWQNWMDVCMNAETGEIYYLYLSRECLRNQHLYADGTTLPDAEFIANTIAAEYGWTLRWLGGEAEGGTAAVFTGDEGTVCYQIDCKAFDTLIDIKLCCR